MPGVRRRLFLASILALSGSGTTTATATSNARDAQLQSAGVVGQAASAGDSLSQAAPRSASSYLSHYGTSSRLRREERGDENAPTQPLSMSVDRRDGESARDTYRQKLGERKMNPVYGPWQWDDAAGDAASDAPSSPVWMAWLEADEQRRYLEDKDNDNDNDDLTDEAVANAMCSEYLISFLEGSTDAKDTCEGIMNAYYAADCASFSTTSEYDGEDEDDYFGEFYEHMCCDSLKSHHSQYCEESKLITNMHLLVTVGVLILCECAKSVVKKNDINFLPEAAVCILVGAFCGSIAHVTPGSGIEDMSFDEDLFLSVLLPPIIFEAAISVSKPQFRRRRGAIFMLAVVGTVLSSFTTGLMVHFMSKASSATTIPMLDSLIFGSLISSIDPVAILSVLSSLNLNQKDMIFILVFGESLLNDGVAITLFQSLVERGAWGPNGGITMSTDELFGAVADFLIVGFGSIGVGLASGILALIYFWMFQNILHPVMEVGSFLLWALIPYYISDGVEWSGIVAIVCMGFFMDMYIASTGEASPPATPKEQTKDVRRTPVLQKDFALRQTPMSTVAESNHYTNFGFEDEPTVPSTDLCDEPCGRGRSLLSLNLRKLLSGTERVRLSSEADKHVRFVAHLTSALSENAIFSYLGLFLYSSTYEWDPTLMLISIVACILSRALMVIMVCGIFYYLHKLRRRWIQRGATKRGKRAGLPPDDIPVINMSRTAQKLMDKKIQFVLVLAGLRGAVSLALMENVPIYNSVTGEGCEFKPLLKAMTSASIIFTTFFFGGGAYYILPHLGIHPHHEGESDRAAVDENIPTTSDISSIAPQLSPRRRVEMANWRWPMCHSYDTTSSYCVNDPDPHHMISTHESFPMDSIQDPNASLSPPREIARQMPSMIS